MTDKVALPARSRNWPIWLAAIAIIAVYGYEAHARRMLFPTELRRSDQGAYLMLAYQIRDGGYAVRVDGARMPLFPICLSFLYRDGMTPEEFLRSAQRFNVNLSIALLLPLFAIFRRSFGDFYALGLLAATAFGLFLRRAPLVQAEVLYYFLGFCAFLFLWRMFVAPSWVVAALGGAATALAHLTKASAPPLLAIWAVVFVAQTIHRGAGRRWQRFAMFAIVIASFLVVVFPYIQESKKVFGRYFYNVNSTFYIWCDTWEEAKRSTRAHGDRLGWPTMPADQIPSARKYWREHSVAQIGGRFVEGFRIIFVRNVALGGHYKFVAFLALACATLVIWRRDSVFQMFSEHFWPVLFCLLFFGCYMVLYSWFTVFSKDSRFVLALFLPFLFVSSKLIWKLGSDLKFGFGAARAAIPLIVAGALVGLAVVDAVDHGATLYHRWVESAAASVG